MSLILGIQFDSNRMVAQVTPDCLKQILFELRDWQDRDWATKRQFQSLVGKLSFVAKCVRPARTFMNRLLEAIRNNLPNTERIGLTEHIRRDIYWWARFLPKYNGVNMIVEEVWMNLMQSFLLTHVYQDVGGE